MGDELEEIARMYGELFGKAASGSYTEIDRKDLYRSLHVIAKRLLELEKAIERRVHVDGCWRLRKAAAERCVQIDDDHNEDDDGNG